MKISGRSILNYLMSARDPAIFFVVFLIVWQLVTVQFELVPRFILPSPLDVVKGFYDPNVGGWWKHIGTTLYETLSGFAIGAPVGVALAVVLVQSSVFRRVLMPYIVAWQVVPKVALAPIIYILLGFTDVSRVFLVFLLSFFPILINTMTGLEDVDRNLVYLLQSLGINEARIFYKVRLPNAMPEFFDGAKIAITGSMIGAVVAEFVSSQAGLGFLLVNAQFSFNVSVMFASMILLTIMGLTLYGAVLVAQYVSMPWFRKLAAD